MKQFAVATSSNLGVPMVAIHSKEEAVEAWGPLMTPLHHRQHNIQLTSRERIGMEAQVKCTNL